MNFKCMQRNNLNMASLILFLTLVIHLEIVSVVDVIKGEPLVPALFAFGDSIIDVGNNNYLATPAKAIKMNPKETYKIQKI